MQAGRLKHLITIQEPVEVQNVFGEPEISWSNVSTGIWAGIEPLRGREFFSAKQINVEIEARIVMRYQGGLNPKMRILDQCHDNNEYYIDTIININEKNKELNLMCSRTLS